MQRKNHFSFISDRAGTLFIKIEQTLHHLPLLVARSAFSTLLENGHVVLPLLLTGQCGKTCHRTIPIEIYGCLHNHHQSCAEYKDLHVKNANLSDTGLDLRPCFCLTMAPPIFGNQLRIIFQLHCLDIPLYGLSVLFYMISFSHFISRFSTRVQSCCMAVAD